MRSHHQVDRKSRTENQRLAYVKLRQTFLNDIGLLFQVIYYLIIPLNFQLLSSKCLDCFIIHNAFMLIKLLFLVDILAVSDLNYSFLRRTPRILSVKTKSSQHIRKIQWSAVKLKHAAQKHKFKCDWGEKPNRKSEARLDGPYRSVNAEDDVLGADLVEGCVESVQVLKCLG